MPSIFAPITTPAPIQRRQVQHHNGARLRAGSVMISGTRLRQARIAAGLTMTAAGHAMGWANPCPQWRAHEVRPFHGVTDATYKAMVMILGCNPDTLRADRAESIEPDPIIGEENTTAATMPELVIAYDQGRADALADAMAPSEYRRGYAAAQTDLAAAKAAQADAESRVDRMIADAELCETNAYIRGKQEGQAAGYREGYEIGYQYGAAGRTDKPRNPTTTPATTPAPVEQDPPGVMPLAAITGPGTVAAYPG